ncbi:hypothetical protein [Streptomyces sp. NPDC060035]|uniref:hypothetical protein n=1 Tax=Streptomyces sp. NPDC060035 TaxID=3347044 RepID=UPI00369E9343
MITTGGGRARTDPSPFLDPAAVRSAGAGQHQMSAQPEVYASVSVFVRDAPHRSVTVVLRSTLAVPAAGTVTLHRPSAPRNVVACFQSVPSVAYQQAASHLVRLLLTS